MYLLKYVFPMSLFLVKFLELRIIYLQSGKSISKIQLQQNLEIFNNIICYYTFIEERT